MRFAGGRSQNAALSFARTDAAYQMLRAQFTARTVEKGYLALAAGELHAGGEIALPLAHDPKDARRMTAISDPEYAEAHAFPSSVTRTCGGCCCS